MKRLRIFISYASTDKNIAGEIADKFKRYAGFEVFLGHDDLEYSPDWLKDIWEKLNKADIVLPLLSENFLNSGFANQEMGIAIARNKDVIPLTLDGTKPKGFIYLKQAKSCILQTEDSLINIVAEIYLICLKHPSYIKFRECAMNSIVFALENSNHFKVTREVINAIIQTHSLKEFNLAQLESIKNGCRNNYEVNKYVLFHKIKDFLLNIYKIDVDK
jgi:hypothetical protein